MRSRRYLEAAIFLVLVAQCDGNGLFGSCGCCPDNRCVNGTCLACVRDSDCPVQVPFLCFGSCVSQPQVCIENNCRDCRADRDCVDLDTICRNTVCQPGCSAGRCSGGRLCDTERQLCVDCLSDSDCRDPERPHCAGAMPPVSWPRRCGVCARGPGCKPGFHCDESQFATSCQPGCVRDRDCSASQRCIGVECRDLCTTDDDCPVDTYCAGSICLPGCRSDRGCDGGACCAGRCLDTSSDPLNCGGCTGPDAGMFTCGDGGACCGGRCANTADDSQNCGGCNRACGDGGSCRAGTCE